MKRKRVSLNRLTTIHQKGNVFLCTIDSSEDLKYVDGCLIGAGSNILIKSNSINIYKLSNRFSYIRLKNDMLICGASLKIPALMRFLIDNSLSSLEFLAGIPATIGGCVYMNAGAFSFEIVNKLLYVKGYKKGRGIITLWKDDIEFGYRTSNLSNFIILEVGFTYEKKNRAIIKDSIKQNINKRIKNAHLRNTFGSIFKNPKDLFAAKLIEDAGLKGLCKNTVRISNKHANYMVGKGLVDIDDALFLIDRIKNEVFRVFSVELEEEVKII